MDRELKRGELYYASLDPVIGSEQGGTRPVLIVQNDVGNRYSPTTIVVAVTSKVDKTPLPTHVSLTDVEGLEKNSLLLLEQIRTIDQKRLKGYVGVMDAKMMGIVDRALSVSVGLRYDTK